MGVVAVGAVLLPLTRDVGGDSFPLSNYPMFTERRPAVTRIERAIGVDADGAEHVLSPRLIGGTVEVIQAAQTLYDAIRGGTADALCAEIAGRVGLEIVEVQVVTERYDVVEALRSSDPQPVSREVHASCSV